MSNERIDKVHRFLEEHGIEYKPHYHPPLPTIETALAYWKELGLTPAGLKKLNEDIFVKEASRANNLMELIKKSKEEDRKNGGA